MEENQQGKIHASGNNDDDELFDDDGSSKWYDGLRDKQRRFVEEYCVDWNATQAAIRAGYSPHTANEQGSQNLVKLSIRKAIDAYLDTYSMTTGEALSRLTAWGRASVEPFIENYGVGFRLDLSTESAKANFHLIKEIGYSASGKPYIKLHDAKDAVTKILQIRGKLNPNKPNTPNDDDSDPTNQRAIDLSKLSDEQLFALLSKQLPG